MIVLLQLLAQLVADAVPALVVLVGLGAAGFLFGRSKAAGGLLAIGLLAVAAAMAIDDLGRPFLSWLALDGSLPAPGLVFLVLSATVQLVRGVGLLGCLLAACVGPAPAREEE